MIIKAVSLGTLKGGFDVQPTCMNAYGIHLFEYSVFKYASTMCQKKTVWGPIGM